MPSNTQWPQSYGFALFGEGPTYVISVQRGGIAHRAGIVPGDHILEVDGHNVTDMSAQAIATLARHSRTVPPTVGVVSRIQNVELIASRRWGFGFTLSGVKPTLVESVDPPGPAYQAGIRPGFTTEGLRLVISKDRKQIMVEVYELSGKSNPQDSHKKQNGVKFRLNKTSTRDKHGRIMEKRLDRGKRVRTEPKVSRRLLADALGPKIALDHHNLPGRTLNITTSLGKHVSKSEEAKKEVMQTIGTKADTNDIVIRRDEFILKKKEIVSEPKGRKDPDPIPPKVNPDFTEGFNHESKELGLGVRKQVDSSKQQQDSGIDSESLGGPTATETKIAKKSIDDINSCTQEIKTKDKKLRFTEAYPETCTKTSNEEYENEEIVELFKDDDDITALVRMINTSLGVTKNGDIVLEVNGHKIRQLELLAPLLSTRYGKVSLTVVPVETKNMSRTPTQTSSKLEASRVRKARDLFAKMNLVLGSDYEKKMAIVGLLKKYAEDRNVETFARALSLILNSPQQARLVKELRPFIPVRHRAQFDSILNNENGSASPSNYPSTAASTTKFTSGETSELGLDLYAEHTALREVTIHRGSAGNFGFILRGHDPVYVESVTPGSPADKAGLRPGDAILKLNGLDVRRSSHGHVIRLLQGSGQSPRITVRHLYNEEGAPIYSPNSISSDESSASSHISSSWLGEDGHVTDRNGHSFRDKVDQLLTTKEKSALRKALMNYNMNRNVAQLVDDLTPILDAPSKKVMWGFLLTRMPTDHREYVLRYVDMPKHQLDLLDANPRPSNTSSLKKSQTTDSNRSSDKDIHHMGSFRQQLDYLLMSRERSQLKRALQIYAEKRNVQHLLEDLSDILDTPSKRTLWFYIIPLLSPPHQRYCQRKLGLPEHVIKTSVPPKGKSKTQNGTRKRGEDPVDVGRNAASPRRGDVVYQQDDFNLVEKAAELLRREQGDMSDEEMADLLDQRDAWQLRARRRVVAGQKTPGPTSGDKHPDSGYLSRDGEQSSVTLNPDYVDAIGRKPGQARHVRMVRETSSQTTPRGSLAERNAHSLDKSTNSMDFKTVVHVYDNPNGRADILELQHAHFQDFSLMDQIDAVISDVPVQRSPSMGLGASVLVNGDYSELDAVVPLHRNNGVQEKIQINQNGLPVNTIDVAQSRTEFHDRWNGAFPSFASDMSEGQNGGGQTLYDRFSDRLQVAQHREQIGSSIEQNFPSRGTPSRESPRQSPTGPSYRGGSAQAEQGPSRGFSRNQSLYQNGNQSDLESETSSAMKNSVTSFESFQTKAMKAIRALDDVVANEPSELEYGAVLDAPIPSIPVPPPPPPPPPAPPPPPLAPGSESSGSRKMQVKRMNWEKIENVDDTMIWSKIGDPEDLADIVKYLELETQFSTRRNKISESFRDRRNEICILNPKKAYNISILLGHLKRGVATVRKALYQMDEQVLNPDLLRQMLAYAPDVSELEKYESYKGMTDELSKADQFMYQLTRVPGYHDRLKAMVFKANFSEKVEEVKHQLSCVRTASVQLQNSKRLARVLELVLAMGNYMNKGHQRVGQAVGFRITFLSQLELTKTSDNKATFLHVLADAVATRFPDALNLKEDLPAIPEAARVSNETIANELADLQRVLEDITEAAAKLKDKSTSATNDRFQEVISNFTSNASNDIKALSEDQQETDKVFKAMVVYFGEDPERVDAGEFFSTFSNFITKFEKAHHHNITHKRHYYKDGTTAAGPST